MTTLTIRRLPTDIIDELKTRARRNKRSLEAELRAILTAAAVEPEISWRCFHCGEVFTTAEVAAGHFGTDQLQQAGCVKKLEGGEAGLLDEIYGLRKDLRDHWDDDSRIQRWANEKVRAAEAKISEAEQRGYDKGVADTLAMPEAERARLRQDRAA